MFKHSYSKPLYSIVHFVIPVCCLCIFISTGCQRKAPPASDAGQASVVEKFKTYYCFPWDSLNISNDIYDEYSGNTKLRWTHNHHFYKYTVISDSEFTFSCGTGNKEILMGRYKCSDGMYVPEFVYDNYMFMLFFSRCGSDCWQYQFVDFSKDTIYTSQALYIDSVNMRYAEMQHLDSSYYIVVYNFHFDVYDTIPTKYNVNNMMNPDLCFKAVSIDSDKVYYWTYYNGDTFKVDTAYMNCPCLK